MKKGIKRLVSFVLLLTTIFSGTAFASENKQITKDDLKIVSKGQLPANVKPTTFNSDEEALQYLNKVFRDITIESSDVVTGPVILSTSGNATVATERIGVVNGKIILKLRYTTSGNGNTGTITSLNPYTTTSGFTYSFNWREDNIGAEITSSGKDVYAYADGVIEYYLLVDGLLKFYERPVSLEGTVSVIR